MNAIKRIFSKGVNVRDNIYKFKNRREAELELHDELIEKLDRCVEISMILEKSSLYDIDYKTAANHIYHAFITIEDLPEHPEYI